MLRSLRISAVVSILILLSFLPMAGVLAQTSYTFHVSFGSDIAPGEYPWDDYEIGPEGGSVASVRGNPVPGVEDEYNRDGVGTEISGAEIVVLLPEDCTLTYVSYQNAFDSANNSGITRIIARLDSEGAVLGYLTNSFTPEAVENTWLTTSITSTTSGATYLSFYSETNSQILPTGPAGFVTMDNIHFTCEDIDEPPPPPEEELDLYQPIMVSAQVSVDTPMSGEEIAGASQITAQVTNPPLFPGEVQVYASFDGVVAALNLTGRGTYNVILTGEVEGDDWSITLNNLSRVYVAEGDAVTAGCVIGLSGAVVVASDIIIEDPTNARQIFFSARNLDTGEFIDWTEWQSPSGDTLCAQSATDCIDRNPTFANNGEFWTPALGLSSSANVVFDDQGALIPPGASISQNLLLPEAGEWDLTISIEPDLPYTIPGTIYASVKVDLGDDSITQAVTLSTAEATTLIIGPLDPTSPTIAPDVYRLRITNTPVSSDRLVPLRVQYACLSPEGATGPPGVCYFMDPEFNDGAGWTLSPGASIVESTSMFTDTGSFLRLPVEEFVSAAFSLSGYGDADAVYRVTLWGNASVLDFDDESMLRVAFDATDPDGDFVQDMEVDPSLSTTWMHESFTYTVPVGETFSGDFFLYNWTDEVAFPDTNINIDRVCLEPVNGVWPDSGEAPPLPYVPPGCAVVPPPPITGDVASWVAWVGALIRYFWSCQAPIWVNAIIKDIQGIQDWIALLGRWLAIVIYDMGQFMWSLTQFMVYELYNLIAGLVEEMWSVSSGAMTLPWNGFSLLMALLWTAFIGIVGLLWTVITALISLAWVLFLALVELLWGVFSALVVAFWSAIISLPLINLFAMGAVISTLLFSIITETLSLIVTAFQVLATMAQIVGTFFTSIQVAFNSTESADIGLIDCASVLDTDPMIGFCLGIEVTEYFIAAFPAMNILGIGIMGALAYHTISLTIEWYRQAFAEAS